MRLSRGGPACTPKARLPSMPLQPTLSVITRPLNPRKPTLRAMARLKGEEKEKMVPGHRESDPKGASEDPDFKG